MPKQYTFKTTQTTDWLEEILDGMPPSERSRFIRDCIIARVSQGQTMTHQIVLQGQMSSDNVARSQTNTDTVTTYCADGIRKGKRELDIPAAPKRIDPPIDEPTITSTEDTLDLEASLDKLNF